MRVVIDTSVWVDHFRKSNATLVELMLRDSVLTHPMVILEIACGTPPAPRARTLKDLGLLQSCQLATQSEVLALIEKEQLFGLGCGLVDLTLLASTLITPGATLWTSDKRLVELAERFQVAHLVEKH